MTGPFRTAAGGRIDRTTTLEFTFDGEALTGHPGDTLASALLASGRHSIATSVKLGRPRGVAAAWAEDPCGLVQIEEPFPEPMLLATTVELYDGLAAHGLPGQGRLADVPDSARYDAVHHHVDVLVVGAGPTGLAAALSDEEWAHYVFFRANPKGRFAERWNHSAGCRRWFNAVRDTATYRFDAVYRLDEPKPVTP